MKAINKRPRKLKQGQATRKTPEPAPPVQTLQRMNNRTSILNIFSMHKTPLHSGSWTPTPAGFEFVARPSGYCVAILQ
ncbi:hypothetical protein TNCV_2937961 [Trichonephila clavipes]|nr:hypothetical protein TNCV_2937961 [Trichonephila clavipes]